MCENIVTCTRLRVTCSRVVILSVRKNIKVFVGYLKVSDQHWKNKEDLYSKMEFICMYYTEGYDFDVWLFVCLSKNVSLARITFYGVVYWMSPIKLAQWWYVICAKILNAPFYFIDGNKYVVTVFISISRLHYDNNGLQMCHCDLWVLLCPKFTMTILVYDS